VHGLTKRYPRRRTWPEILRQPFERPTFVVLDDVTIEVGAGEFFGLLGPNGAGKSTLFKILATLVLADAGRVLIDGVDVEREPARVRERVAPVIADERSLAWRLSARENLRLYAALHGLRGAEATARVQRMLEVVGLEEAGAQLVAKFSSGMRQRLMIARGLLARPKVLLLDEPTRSLDPPAARRFREFLREEIAARQGCTALLATHNTEEALELCDRVGVLHKGSLLAVGTPAELGRRVAEERYRVWTARADDAALTRATGPMLTLLSERAAEARGWHEFEVEVRGGEDAAAEALRRIVAAGITVARFERVPVSLADLIERIIEDEDPG
jgi:ABC-2 type transport system ATP-binding protein